ncbi:alcohol dehydrogenase catalytic domain-containing protein [Gordonia rhizosphera]|uniref:Putative zinc-containing alcohol dehydrogenase n=1 Tax=Gordonia rhizosphera NBRC 16068 TaxID=1108045 RepID=K6X1J9_9ACTN|nr:alcohol dehydrogenase catalytic domain-containing protein [Gordonia rhizosphera]GAB92679.1 putative zinc-containing alcohol dehydrogenase [Gordonia rhizosphera NBRC 16068]
MLAVVTKGGGFEVAEIETPEPAPGELLVEVAANGICGSDLSIHAMLPDGTVMGHEFSGTVAAVGDGVTESDWPIGSPVTSMPVIGCGRCAFCASGDIARCVSAQPLGLGVLPGGLAQYVRVGAAESVRLDTLPGTAGLDVADAALTEPLAVGLHAVTRAGIRPGDRVLVIGAGPVGLAVTLWAARLPVREVVCADLVSSRRAVALDVGATDVLDPTVAPGSMSGFDVVVECVGKPGLLDQAVAAAVPHGRVVIAGVCMEQDPFMPVAGVVKEITMHFVSYYTLDEFRAAAQALATGVIRPDVLVGRRVGFDDVATAFADLHNAGQDRKILVSPSR